MADNININQQEQDADLTMLNGNTNPDGSVNSTLEDAAGDPLAGFTLQGDQVDSSHLRTKDDIAGYAEQVQDEMQAMGSIELGSIDTDLDLGRGINQSVNSIRAQNQSEWIKGVKAVGVGILQGGLMISQQLGHLADFDKYADIAGGVSDYSGNAWTRWMEELSTDLGETEMGKIYEEEADPNSWKSQIFRWSSLQGAVSSAVGFGVTGLGAAKLVSLIGTAGKFGRMAQLANTAIAGKYGVGTANIVSQYANTFATSLTAQYFMSSIMATESYNESMETMAPMIWSGDGPAPEGMLTKEQAQKYAAEGARDVELSTMALAGLGYIKFGRLFKKNKNVSKLVSEPTLLGDIKKLMVGAPAEMAEEMIEEGIAMEQAHDLKTQLGLESEFTGSSMDDNFTTGDYWKRLSQIALSDRTVVAGALGAFGGPIQYGIIQRGVLRKDRAQQREVWRNQQDSLAWSTKRADEGYASLAQEDEAFIEAVKGGNIRDADMLTDLSMYEEISKAAEWGTLSYLEEDAKKVLAMSPEEVAENDFDENYKETANQLLADINTAKSTLTAFNGKANKAEIIFNQLAATRTFKEYAKIVDTQANNLEAVQNALGKMKFLKEDEYSIDYNTNEVNIEMSKADSEKLDSMPKGERTAFIKGFKARRAKALDRIDNMKEFNSIESLEEERIKYKDLLASLKKKGEYLRSAKGEQDFLNKQENATKEQAKKGKQERKERAKEAADTKGNKRATTTFAEIQEEARGRALSQDELDALKDEREKAQDGKTHAIKDRTFTSRDYSGTKRNYTPGDIVREAGSDRTYKVINQTSVGPEGRNDDERGMNMPYLVQVEVNNGKVKEVGKKFILGNNKFLDSSVMQQMGDSTQMYSFEADGAWRPYRDVDQDLMPNSLSKATRRINRAARNVAVSVNIPVFKFAMGNAPAWAVSGEYDLDYIDQPFTEPYTAFLIKKTNGTDTWVDIHRTEDGSDKPISRISRDGNDNYKAYLKALEMSPNNTLEATVDGHFSNKYNIVKQYDENTGAKVYVNAKDLLNNPDILPGGQLYLAKVKGKKGLSRVSWAGSVTTGKDVEGNMIGDYVIPFDKLSSGDTYAFILSPGGRIMPVPLSSGSIKDIPSVTGEGTVYDDANVALDEVIEEVLGEKLIATEKRSNADLISRREKVGSEVDPALGYSTADREAAMEKAKLLKLEEVLKSTKFSEAMAEKMTMIKRNRFPYINTGQVIDGVKELAVGPNDRPLINPNYFDIVLSVDYKTQEVVPAIKVRAPKGTPGYRTTIKTYLRGSKEYEEILGRRFASNSIEELSKEIKDKDGQVDTEAKKAYLDAFMDSGRLTTDIDYRKPFKGSSLSLTVKDNKELEEDSAAEANRRRKLLGRKKLGKDNITPNVDYEATSRKNAVDTINSILSGENTTTLAMKEIAMMYKKDKAAGTLDLEIMMANVYEGMLSSVNALDPGGSIGQFLDEVAAIKPSDDIYTTSQTEMELKNYPTNDEDFIRLYAGAKLLLEKISRGDVELRKTSLQDTKDGNPKLQQPDGVTSIPRGVPIFHRTYGYGTVQTLNGPNKNGKYTIVLTDKNQNAGKNPTKVTVYPSDIALNSGETAQLFRLEKNLALRKNKEADSYKALEAQIEDLKLSLGLLKINESSDENVEVQQDLGLGESEATEVITDAVRYSNTLAEVVDAGGEIPNRYKMPTDGTEIFQSINKGSALGKELVKALPSQMTIAEGITYLQDLVYQTRGFNEGPLASFVGKDGAAFKANVESQMSVMGISESQAVKQVIQGAIETATSGSVSFYDAYNRIETNIDPSIRPIEMAAEEAKKEPEKKDEGYPGSNTQPENNSQEITDQADTTQKKKPKPPRGAKTAYKRMNDRNKINNDDEIIGDDDDTNFKLGNDVSSSDELFNAQVEKAQKMLPSVSMEIVARVADMKTKFGVEAVGAWDGNVVYLVKNAKSGVAYHEVFHAVAGMYLTSKEKAEIAAEYGESSWSRELEEKVADDFADYVVSKENRTFKDKVTSFFKSLMNWFKGSRGSTTTRGIFQDITRSKMQKRPLGYTDSLHTSKAEYMNSLSGNNKAMLSRLEKENRVNIICK